MSKRSIACVYAPVAFGTHRPAIPFPDPESGPLTGTDLVALMYPRELAARGHDVTIYAPRVKPCAWDGVSIKEFDDWKGEASGYDVAISVSNPNCLADADPRTLRCVNRQVAAWGIDCKKGFDGFVELYFCPSESSVRCVSGSTEHDTTSSKYRILPDGCYPEQFEARDRVRGLVAYPSSPDRGLHLLMQAWPEVRQRVPHAELRVYYESLLPWIEFHCDPAKRMGGPIDQECTRRALYVRNALRHLEKHGVVRVGGVSHRQMVKELCSAEVVAYPCHPLAYTETFSVAVLEACAAGCATVISSADCLEEVHGHATAVVRAPVQERMGEFTDLVVRGLTDARFREEMGKLGREHARAHDWRILAGKLEGLIEEGIAEKRAPKVVSTRRMAPESRGYVTLSDGSQRQETDEEFRTHLKKGLARSFLSPDTPAETLAQIDAEIDASVRAQSLEKPRIDLVLTPYASGPEPIDIDRPFDSNSGGGCRAGFMGLVRELPKLGYDVRAWSTFKGDLPRHDRKSEPSYHAIGPWQPGHKLPFEPRDILLCYYDCSPLVGVSGCLRVASHHTFSIPSPGAFEWTDVNLAPSQYAVDALRPVYDSTGVWSVMPNAVQPGLPVWNPQPGKCIWFTSASRGLWNLLEAWPEIYARGARKGGPAPWLHVVGDVAGWLATYEGVRNRQGDAAARTRAAIEKLTKGGGSGVSFLGKLSRAELLRELSEASLFPFTFEAPAGPCETFSLATCEAMAVGVPVAMSFGDALESLWRRAVHRIEPGQVADSVVEILTNEAVQQWLSDMGRKRVAEFTFANKAKALDEAIKANLNTAGRLEAAAQ